MTDITLWWLPDASPVGTGWPVVARGKRGVCYSLPARANGWIVRKRWPDGVSPTSEPLPPVATRVLAWRLRLPGATEPTIREQAEFGEWWRLDRIERDRLAAECDREAAKHGALLCLRPREMREMRERVPE